MALLYQGCCVAPVWQGARAWLPRTVHYQPTERQDATDAGRGASARPRGAAGAHSSHTHTHRSSEVTVCHTWSRSGHTLVTWPRVAHWPLLSCQRPGCTTAQFAPPWQISGSSAATLYETSRQPIIWCSRYLHLRWQERILYCWF